MKTLMLVLSSVFLGAVGQIMLKVGMRNIHPKLSLSGLLQLCLKVFTTPALLFGLTCFGSSFLLWLVVISKEELSYAYPMVSLGYLVVVLASWLLFKENLNLLRLGGLLLICMGVAMVARS